MLTEKDQEISQLLKNVQDKSNQIVELNKVLAVKDQEINELLQNVQDKDVEYTEINRKLIEKDQEISKLLQNAEDKEIQFGELNRKLTEKDQEISELLQNAKDKDIEYTDLNRKLSEKDQEISEILQNAQDNDIEYTDLSRKLTEKDQEISELLQNAQDKDIEYTDLNRRLTEKDQEISEILQNAQDKEHVFSKQITDMQIELVALQRNVSDHVEIVTELNRSITLKDEVIQNMINNFSEKETEIVELKIKLSEKDEENARLLHVVNKKEEELANSNRVSDDISEKMADMEEEAANLNRDLIEKEAEIFNAHKIITEKSDELTELQLKFIEKEQELVSALQSCSDKEERLVNSTGQLLNKEEEISNKIQVISEKDAQVAHLDRLLTEKDAELANVSRNSFVLEEEQNIFANERGKMREMLLEKEADIETKMLQLSEMEAGIKEMSEKLHEREAGLSALVQKLLVQESETKELTRKLSEKENDIDEIRTRLSLEVTTINEELSVRLQDLVEINAKLSAKEAEVNDLSSQLGEKEDNLSEIYETLSKKESVIGELSLNMTGKDAEIYKQSQILVEKDLDMKKMDQVIREWEALIDEIQMKLTEQEGCIVDLNELLAGKETEISELIKQVTVNEAVILNNVLVEKEKEVNALRDEVSSKCQDIDALTMTLKDKDLELTGMNNRITEAEAQLSAIKIIVANKESDHDNCLSQLNSKERDMETLKHISLSLKSEISLLTSRLTDSESLIIELTTRSETLTLEVLNLHVQLREKEFELGRVFQDKSVSDMQLVELTQQLERLEKELREVSQARELVNSSAFVEGQENIHAVKSATVQESHNKVIHGDQSSDCEGDSKDMDWNVERDNMLQSLEVMQQYITEKDLEISKLLVCLDQEKANSARLLLDLTSSKRNNAGLESWISYTLEKMEEKESVMICQELQLEEHSAKIAHFLNSGKESVSSAQQFAEATPFNSNGTLPIAHAQAPKGVDMVDSHHIMQETDLVVKLGKKESGPCSVDMEKNYCLALSQLTLITEECQQKDGLLIKQSLQLEHYSQQIAELSSNLEHERLLFAETTASCTSVREENDNLTAQCQTLLEDHHHLKQQMSKLESETESQRLTSSQYLVECNNLSEQITELSNALEAKENVLAEAKTRADSCVKEMNDLKTDIEQKDAENSHLRQSVESLTTALEKSQEERELLKANFDSCMEDMQQRLGVQDMEIQTVRSQLAEQAMNVHHDKDQLKEIFEHQITLLEEKLVQSEKLCEQVLKELADTKAKYSSCTELYENQVSDLESNLHTANSELSKLKDQLSRVKNNHECEFAGLKRLHEIQTTELEDNCLALERNVSELKRQLSEQINKFNKERINFEQTLEFQVSDNEEKRRMYETEIARLKRHLEEMKLDHELEMKNLEKSCESRLYELEDKCCIATNELERLRKSFSAEGDYSEERHRTDLRIEDLETTRRDLEIKNRALEEEVTQLREQVVLREEELRTLLQEAAEKRQEKHVEMSEEISSLKQSLSELSRKHSQALEEIVKRKDAEVTDLLKKNEQLELKSQSLEMYMEQDVVIRQERSEEKSNISDLQSQIASLSEENSSLKRRLLMQKAPERTLRLSSGVEAICPPYSHTSTEFDTTQNVGDECFSPAVEDPVLEGFVAESQEKYKSPSKKPLATAYGNQEPDFVEEENDRFQPEMEHERVLDSPSQLNMHPIREEEIHEGFQPEISDLFLMDTSEEQGQRMMWSAELTVGMSPSHLQIHQQSFDFNTSDESQQDSTKPAGKSNQSQPLSLENENKAVDVTESRINQIKEDLEEQYVMRMRRQEVDLTCKFETQYEQYKNESEQHFAQRIQAVRYEWERKFTKALRKVKKEMERRNSKDLRYQRHDNVIRLNSEGADSASSGVNMPDIAERNEELDEVVEQLHKENQELAEVRDVLLRQIEISQTRGLHDRLQHELQSMLTTRDTVSFQSSTPTPTLVATSPTIEPEENTSYENPGQLADEADGSRSEISESSSVREGFLEEFEEISHQSSQDLPLEWELTSTETGAFEQEPRSIWEVFDGRCVRQDCQEVDTLRIQYEHQLASLQRQLEAERRGNEEQMAQRQEEYTKALSDLRSHLDLEQQDTLDQIITALSHIHTEELQNLISTHQDELSLELAALKLSLEQIYIGKSQLEAAEQKQWHTQQMEALKKQHKEEINRLRAGNVTESEVNVSLTDDYNRLVKRISQDLETSFYNDTNSNSVLESGSPTTSQELQNLLLSQQEEIISLRTKLLTDYQALLLSRSDLMTEQAAEVNKLEVQMQDIQQQYDSQLVSLHEKISSQSDFQEQESEEHHQKLEQDYNNLKSHYENLIQNMEIEFEDKLNSIKDKYEEQISSILLSGIGKNMAEAPTPNLASSSTQHEAQGIFHDVGTVVESIDIYDGTVSSEEGDLISQMKKLESDLLERDTELHKLQNELANEELRSKSLETELSDIQQMVKDLQEEVDAAESRCYHLEELLKDKDAKINQLEEEKKESEKLYRDLQEKESSLSKITTNGHPSGIHGDDSVDAMRQEVSNTVGAGSSVLEELQSDSEGLGESQLFEGNFNSNNNNNYNNSNNNSCDQLTLEDDSETIDDLKEQLEIFRKREQQLRNQMEEKEHTYKDTIEGLRQEFEHDKQFELETIQSEFRIQLEIELRRQAAELAARHSTNDNLFDQAGGQRMESDIPHDKVPSDLSQSAITEPFSPSSSQKCSSSTLHSRSSSVQSDSDNQSQLELMQTGRLDRNEVHMLGSDQVHSLDNTGSTNVEEPSESLSDRGRATPSTHSSPSHLTYVETDSVNSLENTDFKRQMEAIQEEHEARLNELKCLLDEAEEERTSLTFKHQEEMEALRKQLNESEDRYDRLMEGVEMGKHPQLNEIFQDKYDRQLELTKSLMQKDFDDMLKEEKKSFVEKHRTLMKDLMGGREKEEEEMKEKFKAELEQLRQTLTDQFHEQQQRLQEEIDRLTMELDELRNHSRGSEGDQVDKKNLTLPEIEEIMLSFQDENTSSASHDGSRDTSTPVKLGDDSDGAINMNESGEFSHHYGSGDLLVHRPDPDGSHVNSDSLHEDTEQNVSSSSHSEPLDPNVNAIEHCEIQIRTFADVVKSPPPLSVNERQQLEHRIQQLMMQVERLTQQLAQFQAAGSMSPPQGSLQFATGTLKGDDTALVAMLQSDLDRISSERESVQRINDRLLSLLSDSVKTYVGVEDTINRRLTQVVSNRSISPTEGGASGHSRPSNGDSGLRGERQGRMNFPATDRNDRKGDADSSHDSQSLENTSFQSNGIDEGLEISQRLAESIFVGPDLDAEGEEILADARGRLQTSVVQLLELMERSTSQLIEAKKTQQELLDALAERAYEMDAMSSKCSDLQTQLAAETEAKDYLGLELHKAEGLISGYSSERESLENQIQSLEQQREAMIVDLDLTRSRLEHFERSQSEMDTMREELNHQQQVLRDNPGQEIQVDEPQPLLTVGDGAPALLGEVAILNKDKRELANQFQQQLDLTRKRINELETQAEESERRHEAAIEEKAHELEDLRLQFENVERQLKASKAFVDEQIQEREQEREEHQKEIERLELMLDAKDRHSNAQQRLQIEITDLTEQLQARIASQSDMHQRTLDLQKALQDKELSAHDLKTWVSQLEKELDQRGSIEEQLKMRISRLERQLTDRTDDNAESTEDDCSASLDLKERSPPMILSPVQTQRVSMISLEEELRRCQQVEQELEHENTALKEQVQVQLLQISGLRNQLDQLRHYSGMEADSDSSHLRIKLQDARDNLEKMEEKLSEAHNRIEVLENTLKLKRDEAELIRVKVTKILDMGSAQEENESLKSQLEELQSQMSHLSSISSLPSFPPELLEEKNQQIEELTEKIVLLEEELTQTQQEEAVHKDKIRQFQMRLKEKDEEISDLQDNINSLRRGEPYLDVSLPMNEDANNLLNISMTGRMPRLDVDDLRTSIQQEFEDTILEREGELRSVKENLTQVTKLLEEKEQELQRLRENLTQLQQNKDKVIALEDSAEHKDSEIYQLTLGSEELRQQIQEHVEARELLEAELRDMEEQLSAAIENKNKCELELHEKEDKLDQMIIQIDSLQHEITSLTGFQNELQEDYDTVQSMLEEKEKEIESLTRELIDNKAHPEALETLLQLEDVVAALQKELLEKDNVVEEKEEELYELRDQLEEMGNVKEEMTKIKSQLEEKCKQAEKLKSDLEEALLKEREALKSTEEGQKEAADNNLVSDTLSQRDRTIAELSEKIVTLEQNLIEFSEKCQENASLGEKIESLDHELLEAKEKAASEKGRLLQQIEETREKYEKYIFDLEEEMKCQANDRSAEITKEQYQTTLEENQCLKLEVVEKQAKVDLLQSKLDSALAEEEEIQEKVHRLECQAREVEELSVVKRQLEEAEEQLRLRQSVMLDIQLEKEKLLEDMTEMETLRKVVEDKDRNIEELESQLRFRQSCILDVEAGRESVVEEKEILETQLRRELAEKEQLIKELQALCVKLKGDDTKEMLQQDKEMNGMIEIGTDVHELRHKLLEASDELVNLSTKYRTLEDRLTQSNYQLTEREEQIHQLQAEIQALQQENSRPHPVAVRVQELQRLVQDKEDTAEAQAIRKRKAELAELRTTVYSELQNATRSSRALNLSASLPMDEVTAGYGGMTRWDSEPAGLALGSRDGTYLRLHMNEVEKLARQQQRELSQKNFELEQVRQNLERWLKMGGQNPMDSLIIEKQTVIISLQTELENLRTEINQKEVLISSLQHDIQEMVRSHSQEKADQDHQITQLQEEIYLLKPSNVMASTPKGQSLSPETKQSISQLKMQLRKAHSALEEMRVSHQMTGEFGAGDANSVQKSGLEQEVEKLRELLKAREDELAVLKAQSQTEQEQAVEKALEEQRQTLEGNHEKYINELILQQQEQVKTIREMTQDTDSVDHGQNIESEVLPTQGHDDSMPQRLQALLERLNQLGEHFLSLPDLRYLKQHLAPVNQGSRSVDSGWDTERKALLATIDALKDLLKQVNILSGQESEVCEDWRSGFLQAFVNIYIKEKDVVQAEVSDASISYPDLDIVTQLETKLQQLTDVHQRSLDDLMRADRQSLISEVSSLHQRLSEAKVQLQSSRDEFSQQVTQLEEAKSKLEWKLQRQVQMLEYKLQQEAVIEDDLKKSLKSERQRVSELSSQSTQERSHVLELQSELSSTQIQLSKAKDSLQREQQRFTSITDALEEEKAKSARLSELLDATRRKLKTLEEDMTEADRKQQLKSQSEDSYIMDLQSELRKERQRCVQFSEAEDQARRELHEVSDKLDAARRQLASQQMEYEANIEALHRDQMEREVKHRLEGETQTNARLRELLEAERDQHQAALEQERTIVSKQKHEIEILKSQHDQLTQQYENEKSRADSLKINLDQASSDQGAKKTEPDGAVGSNHERNLRLHLKLVEEDREGLRLKVNELELELERVQTKTRELEKELEQARQASGDPRQISSKIDTAAKSLFVASLVDNDLERRLSQCCSKLQSVATQLDSMTSSSQHYRGSLDHTVQHQGLLVDVLSELRLLKGEITGTAETQQKAEDVESRTEQVSRLLEHNQQLANHIVRLKQEKQHIASSLKQMETKLQTSKHAQVNLPQYASDTASEDDVVYDRTVWASERLGLQMALNSAEHEIERLRTEIQQFRSLVHSDRDIARFDPNKARRNTDRLYGKYLRAESFRKALIYQKKYLLLLLGGYRDTEQETLAILASMGGFPTPYANNLHRSGSRAFTMFRSAGRVIIAISRMKYLVKKWKRATRVGSPVMTGQIPPHHSYVPTSSSFPTHPRHHHHHSKPSSSTHHRNTEVPSVPNGDTYTITTLRSPHSYTTPPTKDLGRQYTTKSLPREGRQTSRRAILQNEDFGYSSHPANGNYHPTQNGDILEYLENVHQHLTEGEYGAGRELL
ncbi:unnamed protein product [Lymnaea stagnalis]|uniref:Pericentrin/AKAP-450 centrosomal targeting domain-containing protein n=1 Tax=Lymnaea stagnalis TaxID=6523 RepID=A0AAV2IBR6_LYMST